MTDAPCNNCDQRSSTTSTVLLNDFGQSTLTQGRDSWNPHYRILSRYWGSPEKLVFSPRNWLSVDLNGALHPSVLWIRYCPFDFSISIWVSSLDFFNNKDICARIFYYVLARKIMNKLKNDKICRREYYTTIYEKNR